MSKGFGRGLVAVLALAWAAARADGVPAFADYAVTEKFAGPVAKLDLSTRRGREFRSALQDAAAQGPNFAGHYVLAQWGCGGGCFSWAVIDARTGKVWFAPFTVSAPECPEGAQFCDPSLEFKPDSELVVATGARNEAGAGQYFYRWHEGKLWLVKAVERKP
ncbi:MAG: hypothetical protein P4L83_00490 [Nevskia sp.]|nr:hypothetical protein [Nevskia sp.]